MERVAFKKIPINHEGRNSRKLEKAAAYEQNQDLKALLMHRSPLGVWLEICIQRLSRCPDVLLACFLD